MKINRLLVLVALATASLPLIAGEIPGLGPRSPLVQLGEQCTYYPTPLEVDGELIVSWQLWHTSIKARRGTGLDSLGPEYSLVEDRVEDFRAAAAPGGFALFWETDGAGSQRSLSFRRFGADLLPSTPPVLVESIPSGFWIDTEIFLEADGTATLAWARFGEQVVRLQRFSAAAVPLGPVATIELPPGAFVNSLQPGPSSLLVGWSSGSLLVNQAFSLAGSPLGAAAVLGEGQYLRQAATEDGGYLSVFVRGGDLYLRRLGPTGEPLEPEIALGLSAQAGPAQLAVDGNRVWLSWGVEVESSELFLARFDLDARSIDGFTRVEGYLENTRHTADRLEPVGDEVLLGWRRINLPAILATPCDIGFATFARAFGPDQGVVDVPALSPLGLGLCALLFAVAGVLLRRTV